VGGLSAQALDYSKIERAIKKEPRYESKNPKYALLLFGQDARVRAWVVLDGGVVYVDRNGDHDLTGKDERFGKLEDCREVEIGDPDGKTRYVITGMSSYKTGDPPQERLMVNVDIKGAVEYQQYCGMDLKENVQTASVAHFHGPLTVGLNMVKGKVPPGLALVPGDASTELNVIVGTISEEHGCWVVVRSHNVSGYAFPKGVHPVVDVEFAPKTAGGPPLKRQYALDQFC
jgi:hypothetical protein